MDELAPRDVVSQRDGRAHGAIRCRPPVARRNGARATSTGVSRRSPSRLRDAGLDPAVDWLPIAPAAHYISGGVITDLDGASALPGLWAAGEASCTGVHGANRLASNSLLEGMVFGARVAEALSIRPDRARSRRA